MRDFQEAGWIDVEKRVIRIVDREALGRRATIKM
jgi:hypothetical protein